MKLIKDLSEVATPLKNPVVTIGNFDGVHIGHQALFRQVIEKAGSIGGDSVAITFEPHPIKVLNCNKHFPLITLYEQKIELISATGIDILICIPFTRKFAEITARTFIKDILCDTIGMKSIIVGQDYSFGKNREGDVSLLKEMGASCGFEVVVSKWAELEGRRISSTEIRNLVREGRIEEARRLLGRHYQVRGTVIPGRDRGNKLLGFPTANLRLYDELCPKSGVYAVTVEYDASTCDGVANVGCCPTFNNSHFQVEVHILDLNEEIYGRRIRVNFIKYLREVKKFPKPEDLSAQIRKDIEQARMVLSCY
ncbi:MAG: bifunctional riboflavin kinase/FAD synthetase [Deltaproteobacteria bacterium]|nr:bifunctional riboflavin kinase/FAD synthetase [Deltaproteobacteria bacterium]RLC11047.1 MAG: riboflavin biosynthesis protein RibF [Deltaproteobacteria bacterium]